ncbi:hypothetical protein YDYSG_20110 [Paenibacillus tyrfis]|nr:hypothetical protein YDYSG_20110 [Paenibacillus tyrfis]
MKKFRNEIKKLISSGKKLIKFLKNPSTRMVILRKIMILIIAKVVVILFFNLTKWLGQLIL